jgi:hypothetical protein
MQRISTTDSITNLSIQLALSQSPVSKKSSDSDSQVRGSAK